MSYSVPTMTTLEVSFVVGGVVQSDQLSLQARNILLTSMSSIKLGSGAFAGSAVHQLEKQRASGIASRLPSCQCAMVRGIPALLRSMLRCFPSVRYLHQAISLCT